MLRLLRGFCKDLLGVSSMSIFYRASAVVVYHSFTTRDAAMTYEGSRIWHGVHMGLCSIMDDQGRIRLSKPDKLVSMTDAAPFLAGITALSLLLTPFLLQASSKILSDTIELSLPTVSLNALSISAFLNCKDFCLHIQDLASS